MRAQPPNNPPSPQLHKGVRTTDSAAGDGLVEDLRGAFVFYSPIVCRRNQGFRFACDSASLPFRNGHITGMAQASQAGYTMSEAIRQFAGGHQMLDRIDGALRNVALDSRQGIHLFPEMDGIAKLAFCDLAQPLLLLAEHERHATCFHCTAISLDDRTANVLLLQWNMARFHREVRAYREADQIVGVGSRMSLVEVVHAPDQPAFGVAPGSEILHVQIADCQHARSL